MPEPRTVGLLKCPNCGGPLAEYPCNIHWRSSWICEECTLCFTFDRGRLVQGRSPREEAAVKQLEKVIGCPKID